MFIVTLKIPDAIASEYLEAAAENKRVFGDLSPKVDHQTFMVYALSLHTGAELASKFDLSLRVITNKEPLLNPVIE